MTAANGLAQCTDSSTPLTKGCVRHSRQPTMEASVKRTVKSAVVVAAALGLATSACSSGSSSSGGGISTDGKGKTVTVWLMSDAQKGWPDVVNQANARFEKATGAKVAGRKATGTV